MGYNWNIEYKHDPTNKVVDALSKKIVEEESKPLSTLQTETKPYAIMLHITKYMVDLLEYIRAKIKINLKLIQLQVNRKTNQLGICITYAQMNWYIINIEL